jgi:hypothetical protein
MVEESRAHIATPPVGAQELTGIGGWLLLLAFAQAAGPIKFVVSLIAYYGSMERRIVENIPVTLAGEVLLNDRRRCAVVLRRDPVLPALETVSANLRLRGHRHRRADPAERVMGRVRHLPGDRPVDRTVAVERGRADRARKSSCRRGARRHLDHLPEAIPARRPHLRALTGSLRDERGGSRRCAAQVHAQKEAAGDEKSHQQERRQRLGVVRAVGIRIRHGTRPRVVGAPLSAQPARSSAVPCTDGA